MGAKNIQEKLQILAEKKSLEESDVVYLLIELAKYKERVEELGDGSVLPSGIDCILFFRNWAVHGVLDKKQAYLKKVLEEYRILKGDQLYDKMLQDLVNEINSTRLLGSLCLGLEEKIRGPLFEIIKEVPVLVKIEMLKIVAEDPPYNISINNL